MRNFERPFDQALLLDKMAFTAWMVRSYSWHSEKDDLIWFGLEFQRAWT